jgi:hypothetical protein
MVLDRKGLTSIKTKWPDRNRESYIQQDGASSHIRPHDQEFLAAATDGNWNIKLVTQPAQSPDTNHLNLISFRALQSKQWDNGFAIEIDRLIEQVED